MAASEKVDIALVAAVEGDAPLRALLAGDMIYSGEIPEGSPLDYVQIPTGAEDAVGHAFGVDGSEGETELHIWTKDTSRMSVLVIYGHLRRLLRRLPLDGHRMLAGRCDLVATMLDPDRAAMHGVVRYRWRTRVVVP